MTRARTWAYWTIPSLLCLVVYWPGLMAWFQQDDFAWLELGRMIRGPADLPTALFAPLAQGTIRPLSERAFFLLFRALFGVDALPFRICVFLTQFANLVLLSAIARRLTGSRLAGFLAPVLWVASSALAVSMAWNSAYNQILCAFFLLLAFYCLLRYIDTGRRLFLAGQWAAFLLGLGALEIAAVYPAIACLYTALNARKHLRKTLPLFAGSAAYAVVHYFAAPWESTSPEYVLHFGPSLAATLWTYWRSALGWGEIGRYFAAVPAWIGVAGTAILTAAILGSAVWAALKRCWTLVFGLSCFLLLLAPVLPLREHVSEYYLTAPVAGLALAGAAAVALARGRTWRIVAFSLAGLYAVCGAVEARLGAYSVAERSWRVRTVALGALRARRMYPGRVIVLTGVDSQLFWTGIVFNPFRVLGISDVYLDPESVTRIAPQPGLGKVSDFVIPGGTLRRALEENRAVIYAVEPKRLRGVTLPYLVKARERWEAEEPSRVDVGNKSSAGQLGSMWYPIENGNRWMPKVATVRLRAPRSADEKLYVSGWCPPQQTERGRMWVNFSVDGKALPQVVSLRRAGMFQLALRLPPIRAGAKTVEIGIEAERTFRVPPDQRDLALVFGAFEIRK
jgi:hypothetical protein